MNQRYWGKMGSKSGFKVRFYSWSGFKSGFKSGSCSGPMSWSGSGFRAEFGAWYRSRSGKNGV